MLLKNHQKFPLQAVEYLPLFQQRGIVKLEVLDKEYNIMDRQKGLFKSIIKILTDNSNDDYSGGIISSDVIYFIIKQENKTVDAPITMKEVKDMLSLLSNPLIDCVGKTKDGYYAKGSLKDAALKFRFYYDVSTNWFFNPIYSRTTDTHFFAISSHVSFSSSYSQLMIILGTP